MRVLVTGFTENYGGVEAFIMNYYRKISKRHDFVIDLLCTTEKPAFKDEIIEMGGKIFTVPTPKHFDAYKTICNFFEKHSKEYEIIWCNKCELYNIDYLKAAKKYGIKRRIIHSHNSSNMYIGLKRIVVSLFHMINKTRIKKYATDFWACSDYAARWLFPNSILKLGSIKYIPNAIDAEKFRYDAEVRREYRKKLDVEHKLVIGSIGRITYQKNPEFILDIFDKIYEKRNDACLLVAGTGDMENEIKQKAFGMNCSNAVKFLGVRKDVPQLMQALDCLLLPSRFEGLPVVAAEAQAAGLPVFAASDGITAQTKLTEQFYFLSLSDNAQAWANAILNKKLYRIDTFTKIKASGFEIESASENLYNMF